MSEAQTASSVSSLAIIERREITAHRPGGCVGIFFQLFDWNPRLAKKKLLPPARSKQASKRFGGDDKMPKTKLHLIADENSRGFPGVVRNGSRGLDAGELKHEMKAVGLVARLMGLESLPASVSRDDKPKIGSDFANNQGREDRFGGCYEGSIREELNVVKGGRKGESRPQKLQKTGQFDRQIVNRLGAEALQIKGVLSRSRKHHHPKLASPKSPRLSSVRNASRTSRLIDAATRILEPGLQATNRAKCAITYSTSASYASSQDVYSENFGNGIMLTDLGKQKRQEQPNSSNFEGGICISQMGKSSCKNCGILVDVADTGVLKSSCTVLSDLLSVDDMIRPRRPAASFRQERQVVNQRDHDHVASSLNDHEIWRSCVHEVSGRKSPAPEDHAQWHWQSRSEPWQSRTADTSCFGYQERIQSQNGRSASNDAVLSWKRIATLQTRRGSGAENVQNRTKDFVALNRSLSGQSRSRVLSRTDDSAPAMEKKAPVRKKRTTRLNSQVETESKGVVNLTTVGRRRNPKRDLANEKDLARNYYLFERPNLKTIPRAPGASNRPNDNQAGDAVAFRFSSQLNNRKLNNTGPQWTDQIDENSHQSQQAMDEKERWHGNLTFDTNFPLKGAALGELLEQKLQELASEEYEQSIKGALHKRSTAAILQEQKAGVKAGNDFLNHITEDLQKVNLACGGLISYKLTQAKEVIMNAELVFENPALPESDSTISSLLRSCLLEELNTVAASMSTNIRCLGYKESKESTLLRRFIFDCLEEFLDLKYGSGFKLWRRVPLHMNATVLIQEVAEEVQRWAKFSGMIPDEIIEWEMSHSLGKWTDFEVEAFENVAEIGKDILQILVQEVVIDLWECRMAPF